MAFPFSLKHILKSFELKGLDPVYAPHMLNIVGIRMGGDTANTFNDWITAFRRSENTGWEFYAFQATTDPGLYWRTNPMNVDGTAIVCPGQYLKLWRIGQHKGYTALVQVGRINVWRDNNRNEVLEAGRPQEGIFGINLHRANAKHESTQVDKWSAGCQVIADPYEFDTLMFMALEQDTKTKENLFDYTLLEETDLGGLNV